MSVGEDARAGAGRDPSAREATSFVSAGAALASRSGFGVLFAAGSGELAAGLLGDGIDGRAGLVVA